MIEPSPTNLAASDAPERDNSRPEVVRVRLGRVHRQAPAVVVHDVLTVPQAASLLKIGRNALYDACGRNEVPHRRIGRQIRFSRAALVAWLASWSKQGAQKGQ